MKLRILLHLALLAAIAASAHATITVSQFTICSDGYENSPFLFAPYGPAISGNIVVWQKDPDIHDWDLYGYDLATHQEFPIITDRQATAPDISGDMVIWSDYVVGHGYNIYDYNLATHQASPICPDAHLRFWPKIDGNIVVWQDDRNLRISGDHIYGYDIAADQEFAICANGTAANPEISGNFVVWMDWRRGTLNEWGNRDIYGYDLATQQEFCISDSGYVSDMAVSGNFAVWADGRSSGPGIYGYNLATHQEFPICINGFGSDSPDISGNIVIWRENDGDIHGLDLLTYEGFSIGTTNAVCPAIDGNNIVWRDAMNNIYGATIVLEPATLALLVPALLGFAGIAFRRMRRR
jgi:beta propeller repeat protein